MPTTSTGNTKLPSSITRWIHALREGDEQAAHSIWAEYFDRISIVARHYLKTTPQRMADDEDVVAKAFNSREDLWQILIMLTSRHAIRQAIAEKCQKRGGGMVRTESAFPGSGIGEIPIAISAMSNKTPTPEFIVMMIQQCQYLIDSLPNKLLRDIALLRFEGFASAEIAARTNRSIRTVQRKLVMIRSQWPSLLERELDVD